MEIKSYLDIEYTTVDETSLCLNIFRPADDKIYPIILHVHGGGWCLGQRAGVENFTSHVARGYVVVDIDYRLAPGNPYPAACDDVRSALQWIVTHAKEYGGDSTQIGGIGYSAGGHLLALQATESQTPLKCVVCWGNPTDLRNEPVTYPYRGYAWAFMSACPNEEPKRYIDASPAMHLTVQTPPILHIHGTADTVVPIHHAHLLSEAAACASAPVKIIIQQGGGHCVAGNEEDDKQAETSIWQFFEQHLNKTLFPI
ncbi:MAG: alpha/beta hydrolase [bacterium]